MEFCEFTFDDYIKKCSIDDKFDILQQLAEGVHFLNIEKKIIIRDLKIGNLMVKKRKTIGDKDKLKFIDLDTLKNSNDKLGDTFHYIGSSTPLYCPPEILMDPSL